jgi:hypothetical protein
LEFDLTSLAGLEAVSPAGLSEGAAAPETPGIRNLVIGVEPVFPPAEAPGSFPVLLAFSDFVAAVVPAGFALPLSGFEAG